MKVSGSIRRDPRSNYDANSSDSLVFLAICLDFNVNSEQTSSCSIAPWTFFRWYAVLSKEKPKAKNVPHVYPCNYAESMEKTDDKQ